MKEDKFFKQFIKDRNEAFTRFVMNDDWKAVEAYCKKYFVEIPEDKRIAQAGIYKAIQYCTDIPEEVKIKAMKKCIKLGFNPFIKPADYEMRQSSRS